MAKQWILGVSLAPPKEVGHHKTQIFETSYYRTPYKTVKCRAAKFYTMTNQGQIVNAHGTSHSYFQWDGPPQPQTFSRVQYLYSNRTTWF